MGRPKKSGLFCTLCSKSFSTRVDLEKHIASHSGIPTLLYSKTMDADFHLRHKALYVEPMRKPVDWNKMPADGNEYIYRVRAEAEATIPNIDWGFCPALVKALKAKSLAEGRHLLFPQWKRNEGYKFCSLSSKLASNRKELMNKYPKNLQFPQVENEKEVCLFLLGSKFYNEIFSNECVEETAGHSPLLSIVLHVTQEEILTILKYLKNWCDLTNEMSHDISVWIHALLACLDKPISKECEVFLEEFYDDCVKKNKGCREKNQFQFLETILYNGFALKSHLIISTLKNYSKLRYCK